jgi:hypothetical protein
MDIAFRRRAKARSLAESLTAAFEELRDATTEQVITAETGMAGLARRFCKHLVRSYNSVADLWARHVESTDETEGDLPGGRKSPVKFVAAIETSSLFPVPRLFIADHSEERKKCEA